MNRLPSRFAMRGNSAGTVLTLLLIVGLLAMGAWLMMRDKKALMELSLPGKLLFLFRIRFGLYAVLARLGAVADWAALESAWAAAALGEPGKAAGHAERGAQPPTPA